ncbi:MAG: MMPL family transporter [bacterium]|nr:MMPL family transporter [bacterium]
MKKVGEKWFKRYSVIAVCALFVSLLFFLYYAAQIEFDYDFEKFYPTDDPETEFFIDYREKFESDNDFLLIAIENEGGIYDLDFLKKVDALTNDLKNAKYVKNVLSITQQKEYFIIGGVTDEKPYINFEDVDLKRDSANISTKDELVNNLVAKDGKSVCLFVRHKDFLSKKGSDVLITNIERKAKSYGFNDLRIGGRAIGQKYYIDKMSFEMILFLSLSAVLVVIFLLVAFKSIWGIMIPQAVIVAGMIWLVGGMSLANQPMNIILTVLPSVMFVVSMSDVIHLVSRYLDALRELENSFEATKVAVREVGLATLLTSITTAIGFFSLIFVRVEPIQVFGTVMGIGVMIAFILTFAVLPALFYLTGGPKYITAKKKDHFWRRRLEKWFLLVGRNKKTILGAGVVVLVLSVVGIMQLESDNMLMDDISEGEPLKQDFNYLDDHYGGARPFEMAVTIRDTNVRVWDQEVLKTIDTVENYLTNSYGVNIKMSVVTAMKVLNRGMNLGKDEAYKLPERNSKRRSIRRALRVAGEGQFVRTMLDSTETILRISGTIPDLGNKKVTALNEKLEKFLKGKTMGGKLDYQVTGTAHLVDKNLRYMSTSLVKGLAVSILIVALIMGLIYRSFSMMLISLVPNIFPLVFIGGAMGFLGVDLKISTAIIFTIAFGIAVDDTIHLLGKFKYELMKGKGVVYALRRSYFTTGKAMILTTLILCSGFLLLVFSSFLGTFYLGIMLCLALIVALIADLTILPVLILLFYKPKKKES